MQGQPVNLDLLRRTTRADFYSQLAISEAEALYPAVTMEVQSDADQETYAFFGAPTKPVRTDVKTGSPGSGVTRSTPFKDYGMSLKNATWVYLQEIDRDVVEDAKLNQVKVRAQEAAAVAASFQDEQLSLTNEANGLAYDAVAFYASTHHGGSGATKDNDIVAGDEAVLDITVTTQPTVTDAENTVAVILQRLKTITDDQGRVSNAGDLGLVWFVPPGMERAFRSVIEVGPVAGQTGNTGVFKSLGRVIVNPYSTNGALGYAFVTSKPIKPIVYQTRIPWDFKLIVEGDDWEKKDKGALKGRARFQYMLGDWKKAMRWTYS